MDNTAQSIPRMTAGEYLKITPETTARTELRDGEITALASPGFMHQRLSLKIASRFDAYIEQNKGRCEPFIAPLDVRLDDFNVVQSDIFIICDPDKMKEHYLNGAPDFVAEIVSSNRSDDFDRKLWLYRRSGVREYWIIDLKNERVYVYFFENGHAPEIYDFHTPIPVQIWEGRLCICMAELLTR